MLTAEQREITRLELALNDAEIANKQLQQRNAELAAQVEQSDAAKTHTARVSFRAGALRFEANLYLANEAADKYIETMPAQCLSERDREVAARAVRLFHEWLLSVRPNCGLVGMGDLDKKYIPEYANKIKSGEVSL